MSKPAVAGDLETIKTLGFRDEALPGIAVVATRLELTIDDDSPWGARVVVDSGENAPDGKHDKTISPAGRARGTTVDVTGLLVDRPTWRKSLVSSKAESARISTVVTRYTFTRLDVQSVLRYDGREALMMPGTDRFTGAFSVVYSRDATSHASTFNVAQEVEVTGETATVEVGGALCHPEMARSQRDHVHVSVSGHILVEPQLRRAVVDGYGTLFLDGREPVGVVRLRLSPAWVDHSIYPAKDEVGFRDTDVVVGAAEASARGALSTADLWQSGEVAISLDSLLAPVEAISVFDDPRVIEHFHDLYLLCEADDELFIIDQYAAHEHIDYERLRGAVESAGVGSTAADPPITVSLSPADAALLNADRDPIEKLGFHVVESGKGGGAGTYRAEVVPALLGRPFAPGALADMVTDVASSGHADPRDELLKGLTCHPSIKADDDLTDNKATRLVERLDSYEAPYTCPCDRPTVLSTDEEMFAHGFDRRSGRFG